MKQQEKIEQLQKGIEALKASQRNCMHVWEKAIYDPETIQVQDDRAGYEEHGSDRWPKLSFHPEQKDRWSRECEKCGIKQYTYEQETVVKETKSKF